MKRLLILAAAAVVSCAEVHTPAKHAAPEPAKKRRGVATATPGRPAHFPHRIWAASGFEARTPNFGWFGAEEKRNIPKYSGNTAARRGAPRGTYAAMVTGMNPVPGPRMGTLNRLYLRYYLKGTDTARFQHYSLSVSDNCNIRVSGLTQGRWAETVLNFTEDSRRNDGSPGAFKKGERMDDLKIFVGKFGDGKPYELIIDDAIFFSTEPGAKPDDEPFPNRVIFLAAFDTGVRPEASRQKYFPGRWALPAQPPAGCYWLCAEAVPVEKGPGRHALLKMTPPRSAGAATKLRFRGWVSGSKTLKITLADAAAKTDRVVELTDLPQGKWFTRHVDFTKGSKAAAGKPALALAFVVGGGEGVRLCVDEVVLYDAGQPSKK